MKALRSVSLFALVFIPGLALSEVIDDVVVMNHDAPEQFFNVSANDNTGGACAANLMPDPIASCPCNFNGTIPDPTKWLWYSGSITGDFSYQPFPGATGIDAFGYLGYDDATATFCDGTNTADITIVINADPQLAAPMDDVSVAEDALDSVIPLGVHFSDSDTGLPAPYTDVLSYAAVVIATDNPGLFNAVSVTGDTLTLDYAQDQFGTATIEVTATDNRAGLPAIANFVSGNSVSTTFVVKVISVNDPPVAFPDSTTTNEDTLVNVAVLPNDSDVEDDPLTVTIAVAPTNGAVLVKLDNTVDYTPNGDFNGIDTFTYQINDGNFGTDTAVVTVTVDPVNDVPVAVVDDVATDEDVAIVIAVVDNDTDVDFDALTLFSVSTASNGAVVDNLDDTVTYTPAADFNGVDSFTYVVSDGNGGTDTGTVNVVVNAVNDTPYVATPLPDGTFNEDDLDQSLDLSTVFDDVDIVTNGDDLSYMVDANDNPGLMTVTVTTAVSVPKLPSLI